MDMQRKKTDALAKLVEMDPQAMALALRIQEFVAYVTDCGFLTGGANAITDADCVGENAHLDAALFNNAVSALGSMTLSTNNKTTLRKASRSPVPGG